MEELWIEEGIEIGIEKGIEKGIQKGIEKGIEKGIASGEWMGKVQLLETLLDRTPTESAVLRKQTVRQLQTRFHKLEREYDKKHRR
jgi:flagellar biosynthesis/type III secretory pathway protein FliH